MQSQYYALIFYLFTLIWKSPPPVYKGTRSISLFPGPTRQTPPPQEHTHTRIFSVLEEKLVSLVQYTRRSSPYLYFHCEEGSQLNMVIWFFCTDMRVPLLMLLLYLCCCWGHDTKERTLFISSGDQFLRQTEYNCIQ